MARPRSEQHRDPTVFAIERILEAERSAEVGLRDCRRQAEALIAAARERAATITQRANTRLSKLHSTYFNRIGVEAAKLSAPASTGDAVYAAIDDAELARAAHRLATKLTGAT